MKIYASADIGGTTVKYGIVTEAGEMLFDGKADTHAENGGSGVVESVCAILKNLIQRHPDIAGIGVSTAGIVDNREGKVIYANDNIPEYTGTEWKKILEQRFGRSVLVNNDVNAAALAESWVGSARGIDNFFCLTIGTGIGGAAFVNGRLYTGSHSRAAEIGYMVTKNSAGRFEKYASTLALVKAVEEATDTEKLNGKNAFQMAKNNKALSKNVFAVWIDSLARGIANVICLFDPSLIVVGGGISREGDGILNPIKQNLTKYIPPALMQGISLRVAACQNNAGIIGAVYGFTHRI